MMSIIKHHYLRFSHIGCSYIYLNTIKISDKVVIFNVQYVLQIAEEKFEEFSDRLQLELMDSFEKASKVRLKEVKENLNDLQTHYKCIH
jgi:hypothetical protein